MRLSWTISALLTVATAATPLDAQAPPFGHVLGVRRGGIRGSRDRHTDVRDRPAIQRGRGSRGPIGSVRCRALYAEHADLLTHLGGRDPDRGPHLRGVQSGGPHIGDRLRRLDLAAPHPNRPRSVQSRDHPGRQDPGVDPQTGRGVQFFDVASGKSHAIVQSSTTTTHGVVISPDSRYAFVSVEGVGAEPGKVDISDLRTFERVADVPVAQQAGGIAFWKMSSSR